LTIFNVIFYAELNAIKKLKIFKEIIIEKRIRHCIFTLLGD